MKKIYRILTVLAVLSAGLFSTGCKDDFIEEITGMDLYRCLQPMNLAAKVSGGQNVTFSWDVTKDAEQFNLAVYSDEAMTSEVFSAVVDPSSVPYTRKLDADSQYWFKVQATSSSKEASKWAEYEKSIKTYAVKDPLYLKVSAREATSISVVWSTEVADFKDVTHIEYGIAGSEETTTVQLGADAIAAGAAKVEGLTPSTEYVITLYYASASRGEVDAWTMPDTSSAVEVSTSAALEQGMKDGAVMYLKMDGSPYTIGGGLDAGLDVSKGFKLLGESSADGTRPVIVGAVSIAPDFNGGDIYFEGVEFDGNNGSVGHPVCLKNGGTGSLVPVASIIYRNCAIHGYSKGLIYEWNQTFKLGELTWDSCEIYAINADGSGGGDVVDFRGATQVEKLSIVNNTLYDGMRTFIRIDNGTWGAIRVENNTMRNLCLSDNSNNAGIIAINKDNGTSVGEFTFRSNLLLDMPEKATLGSGNAKYYSADDLGISFSNNFYYNVPATFWTDNFKQNGTILATDPCFNSKGGFFNLTDTDVANAKAGASKWWTPYVEEPEDLTLNTLAGAHTWDFGNAKYFIGDITKAKVRDGLLMYVETRPMNVENATLYFKGASITNKRGVPTDGYIAFKVDGPGSVIVRPVDGADAHVIVAVGDVDGAGITVKGGASELTLMGNAQKILVSDITGESIVYVYASGPIGIAQLAWSLDTLQVNTALPTPEPAVNPTSVTAGDAKELTVSWAPVENAASYSVVFNGKTYPVEETTYVIGTDVVRMLDAGSYTVDVYANPGENDIYNTQSSVGKAAFAVLPAGGSEGETEFVVSSVDDLLNAIDAGKTDITLAYSDTPYAIGSLKLTSPLRLKGQVKDGKKTPVTASFTLSGEIGGSVILRGLEFVGDGTSVLIEDKTAGPVADTVAIFDSYLHGTKAMYDNSGKATSNVQYLIFDGNIVEDSSAGADFIDLRTGAHHNFIVTDNTFANSCRTFVRTDAAHEMNYATIRNNTFYKVATNSSSKDNNGIFHIRSAAGAGLMSYKVQNNIFYSILIDETPSNANGFPKLRSKGGITPDFSNNYYYNCEDREDKAAYSFWAYVSKEEGLAGGGAILASDPFKDAEKYDFTLVNGVAMNAGVGDPRWNPMAGSTPSSEITVENVADLLTAISAGKKAITLKEGTYDLTAITDNADVANGKLTLVSSLDLQGPEGARIIGGFIFKTGVERFTLSGVTLDGGSTVDNAFEVGEASVQMNTFALRNSRVSAFKNRLFYMNNTGSVASAEFSGNIITGVDGADFTSGDFIDVRKGTVSALKVQNNTFANAIRTFARVDAAVVMNSALIANNTFYNNCYVDSKDNNGILHFRSSTLLADPANLLVSKNIFASMHRASETPSNANGFPKIVSTASEKLGHPTFYGNYYYDIDEGEAYGWWNTIGSDEPLAGNGVILTSDPFKAAASGDFTLVNALASSENVGDPRWIKSGQQDPGASFTVASVDELLAAVSAGKTDITLKYGTYDLTAATDENIAAGTWKLAGALTLRGQSRNGLKPELIGAFKPAGADAAFALEGLRLNGNSTIGNMVDIDAAAVLTGVTIKDCEVTAYTGRLVSNSGTSAVGPVVLKGLTVYDMGTSGDFIDIRKGKVESVSVTESTFYNGIRTFVRIDAAVECGAVIVKNNTFYNLGAVDSKDNNGILHVRSTSATSNPRQIVVSKNIFASMHRAVETPSNAAAGFPHMISKTSAAIAVPAISDNLFWDIDATGDYSWWTYMPEENVAGAGQVLDETPFAGDPAAGKFGVKAVWKGYGDTRW